MKMSRFEVDRIRWQSYQRERELLSAALVHALLAQFGYQSMASRSRRQLCLVRYFDDLPLCAHPWNAMLVTRSEALPLARLRPRLPPLYHHYMHHMRVTSTNSPTDMHINQCLARAVSAPSVA